jgi:pimeloyl-ACP methyl ester carboxylesterase
MAPIGINADPPPAAQLPRTQRLLRALPAPLLKVANSSFLSATSASLSPKVGMPANAGGNAAKKAAKRRAAAGGRTLEEMPSPEALAKRANRESFLLMNQQSMPSEALAIARATSTHNLRAVANRNNRNAATFAAAAARPTTSSASAPHLGNANLHGRSSSMPLTPTVTASSPLLTSPDEQASYDELLTLRIWAAATTRANPAVDLVVCLEHSTPIGFRYVDITRACVIHHGTKDNRVPVENIKWLAGQMRKCEVKVLEGEGHGLMASAGVMGGVLTEMAAEWEEWDRVVKRGRS